MCSVVAPLDVVIDVGIRRSPLRPATEMSGAVNSVKARGTTISDASRGRCSRPSTPAAFMPAAAPAVERATITSVSDMGGTLPDCGATATNVVGRRSDLQREVEADFPRCWRWSAARLAVRGRLSDTSSKPGVTLIVGGSTAAAARSTVSCGSSGSLLSTLSTFRNSSSRAARVRTSRSRPVRSLVRRVNADGAGMNSGASVDMELTSSRLVPPFEHLQVHRSRFAGVSSSPKSRASTGAGVAQSDDMCRLRLQLGFHGCGVDDLELRDTVLNEIGCGFRVEPEFRGCR